MAPGVCLYGYACLPIYCMYTVRENDIVDNTVKIPIRMIREFGCADGWIGIVQYDSFARLADRHTTDDGSIYDSILLLICVLGRFDNVIVRDALKDLAYQFWPGDAVGDGTVGVGLRPVECRLSPDENRPGCKIEEYGHAKLDLSSSLADFS